MPQTEYAAAHIAELIELNNELHTYFGSGTPYAEGAIPLQRQSWREALEHLPVILGPLNELAFTPDPPSMTDYCMSTIDTYLRDDKRYADAAKAKKLWESIIEKDRLSISTAVDPSRNSTCDWYIVPFDRYRLVELQAAASEYELATPAYFDGRTAYLRSSRYRARAGELRIKTQDCYSIELGGTLVVTRAERRGLVEPAVLRPELQSPDVRPTTAADRFTTLANRFDSLAVRHYAKPVHLCADMDQNTIPAARLLEHSVDAGFISDKWAAQFVKSSSSGALRHSMTYSNENERLGLLWTFAIGSWLKREYPTELRGDAGPLDWLHRRVTPEYRKKWAEFLKNLDAFHADLRAGRIKPGTKGPSFEAGDSIECVEQVDYDSDDHLNRHRARAQAYADACRLLGRLVQTKRPTKARKKPRRRNPRTEPTKRQAEAWAVYAKVGTYAETGRQLGISGEGARKLVEKADAILNDKSRSVRATQTLPTDRRGQA